MVTLEEMQFHKACKVETEIVERITIRGPSMQLITSEGVLDDEWMIKRSVCKDGLFVMVAERIVEAK